MDKNAIKKYAVWARRELISRVSQRAAIYGITENDCGDPRADSIHGQVLTPAEKKQRQALIAEINDKGYKQVMEEVAYTWFNRFSALRFMEVNGYLPSHVRVFTDEENNFKPQIIAEAIHLNLDGLDMEKVYEPVFGLDLVAGKNRTDWYDKNFYASQPYMSYGVVTDDKFRPCLNGDTVGNLYATGALLSGFNALKEGSGAGITLATALHAAGEITR